MSLPNLQRPTRDDFLRAADGFWQRLRVRFRWLTIRSFRRYNADEMSAFFTWFLMSQTLWLFVGTTTFFSVVFATANSLRLQEYIARALSDYLTAETGITIIFESAIVPKWRDSRISFKNVFITRRPEGYYRPKTVPTSDDHSVAAGYDLSNHPSYHGRIEEEEDGHQEIDPSEDLNYSMFDLTVDSIDVTLSFARWFDGKGLVEDAVIKGVRGVLDRRTVTWDPDHPLDPATFRHKAQPGDFELESLQLEDVLVTVYQPGNFRPYTASIFRADIRTFRKQFAFYDFLRAENVVGQFDNCLFSLHRPQSIGRTTDQDLKDGKWSRMSRFRMDGLNVDHLQSMTTQDGPFSWITSGKVDAVLDIKFPRDPSDELPFSAILDELADALTSVAGPINDRIPGQRELAKPPLSAPSDQDDQAAEGTDDTSRVIVDIDLRFRDLKAAVPLFTNDLSYVNNALIRPIVAFMNANRTLVPIRCRVVKDLEDFDGAWTMWETGLIDAISMKVYEAMAYHVTQANFHRRVKAVGAWSLQMTASALMSTLRMLMDPMTVHLRDIIENGSESVLFQVPYLGRPPSLSHDPHPQASDVHHQHNLK
ncbi:mitochondrial distribution and morphology protein family 31/32 [Lentinus tigrinus ALCF2SS1-7]|uniref:Mitochondrial distribution and morphology protein family 31/32 n=1 Tax=Lentinus tigrinus ALCF2SS1-6 TaxID=1328759 RepID=A0A5C2S3Y3_9APHY|nr:mitochondrial distribution and morphology protein family 31/32 [Lentinus tigrinus ALCF2SS1-6]RPD78779.1 mitochondrial distribution and morphology protein family 31/32 [Lentinus tigrinus ALCF2SS1-7]